MKIGFLNRTPTKIMQNVQISSILSKYYSNSCDVIELPGSGRSSCRFSVVEIRQNHRSSSSSTCSVAIASQPEWGISSCTVRVKRQYRMYKHIERSWR